MVSHKRDLRRRNQSREPGHELHWTHDAVSASPRRCLHQVRVAPIGQKLDSIECEGRAGAVPHEPFAPLSIICCDAPRAMHVEPIARGGEASLPALESRVGTVLVLERPRKRSSTCECELGTRIERGGLDGLVAALLGRALVEVTAAP